VKDMEMDMEVKTRLQELGHTIGSERDDKNYLIKRRESH